MRLVSRRRNGHPAHAYNWDLARSRRVGGIRLAIVGGSVARPQQLMRCRGELWCQMRFAVVSLHQTNSPRPQVDRGALGCLNKRVAVL